MTDGKITTRGTYKITGEIDTVELRLNNDVYSVKSIAYITAQSEPPHKDIIRTTQGTEEILFEALA